MTGNRAEEPQEKMLLFPLVPFYHLFTLCWRFVIMLVFNFNLSFDDNSNSALRV
jgi:hypothetical protein